MVTCASDSAVPERDYPPLTKIQKVTRLWVKEVFTSSESGRTHVANLGRLTQSNQLEDTLDA